MFISERINKELARIASEMVYGEPVTYKNPMSLTFAETYQGLPLCTPLAAEMKSLAGLKVNTAAAKIAHEMNHEFPWFAYFYQSEENPNYVNMVFTERGVVSLLAPFVTQLNSKTLLLNIKDVAGYKRSYRDDPFSPCNVSVEYISANPTGPLHIGHLSQAIVGNSLSNVLKSIGLKVKREYYCNDAGAQIENLVDSVIAREAGLKPGDDDWKESYYAGEYVNEIVDLIQRESNVFAEFHENADSNMLRAKIVAVVKDWHAKTIEVLDSGIFTDSEPVFSELFTVTSEKSLFDSGEVDKVISDLKEFTNLTYEKDGALWFKSTEFGDDKDRVMVTTDGRVTYFVPDAAYHLRKIANQTDVINIQGSDHHGTATRVKSAVQALADLRHTNNGDESIEYIFLSMVKVVKDKKEVKMSKRSGSFITADEVMSEHSPDVLKWFILSRKPKTNLVIDINDSGKGGITHARNIYSLASATFEELSKLRAEKVISKDSILNLRNMIDFYEIFSESTPGMRKKLHYWRACKGVDYIVRCIYMYPSVIESAIRPRGDNESEYSFSSSHIVDFIRKLSGASAEFMLSLKEARKVDVDVAGNEFMTVLLIEAAYTLMKHAFMLLDIKKD